MCLGVHGNLGGVMTWEGERRLLSNPRARLFSGSADMFSRANWRVVVPSFQG